MLNHESDDEQSIIHEINDIESKLDSLNRQQYELSMKRKFLNHHLADLKYEYSKSLDGTNHGI